MSSLITTGLEFRLYDDNGRYINAGDYITIIEPTKIDGLEMVLKRDSEFHGVIWSFSDGEVDLEFDNDSPNTGKALVDTCYDHDGVDMMVRFMVYSHDEAETIFIGNLQGKSVKKYIKAKGGRTYTTARVKEISFEETFRSRIDAEVDIIGDLTIEGETAGGAATTTDLHIDPPFANRSLDLEITDTQFSQTNNFGDSNRVAMFLPRFTINSDSVGWLGNYPPTDENDEFVNIKGVIKGDILNLDPEDDEYKRYIDFKLYSFKHDKKGEWWKGDMDVDLSGNVVFSGTGLTLTEVQWAVELIVMSGGALVRRETIASNTNSSPSTPQSQTITISGATISNLSLGFEDEVYIYVAARGEASFITNQNYKLTVTSSAITYNPVVYKVGGTVQGFTPQRALQKAIRIITGRSNTLSTTTFFDGMGKNTLLHIGDQIKQITPSSVYMSVESILRGLNALYWIGYSIDQTNRKVLVDHARTFYADKEILRLEMPYDYTEEEADDLIYNQYVIGYKDVLKDDDSSALDCHNQIEFINEVKTVKRKYTQLCDFKMSAPLLLKAIAERDEKDQDDKERSSDQDLYLFSYLSYSTLTNVVLFGDTTNDRLIIAGIKSIFLSISSFSIPSGTYAGSYTIDKVDFIRTGTGLYTAVSVTSTISSVAVVSAIIGFTSLNKIEQNEEIAFVTTGYDSFPNLRFNVKAMLANHSPWLNMSLDKKTGTKIRLGKNDKDIAFSLDFDGNGDYSTLWGNSTAYNYSVEETQSRFETYKLFQPKWINFNHELTWAQLKRLKEALRNESSEDINFGYVTVIHPETREEVKFYPFDIRKNLLSRETKFKGLKKYDA